MSIRNLFDYTQPATSAATILALAFVIVGAFAGVTTYQIKNAGDIVSVTGSARESVRSDYAKLTINLETNTGVDNEQSGFDRLDAASKRIINFLQKEGFKDVEVSTGSANPQYIYPEKSAPIMTGYSVSRQVIVRSDAVEKMQQLANTIAPFSGEGYIVTINGLELTYRKLDTMRVGLLAKAIRDARARADAIAKESGRSVGTLKSSASGVVQVLPKGGIDVSDYGTYDTQSLEKEVMVTVRATFSLN